MNLYNKPVIVIGHGVRAAGADPARLLELGAPVITSWQAMDLVDNWHPSYMGRVGIFGQRCANRVLYEAQEIIAIGCRLSPWMIGHGGLRPEQVLTMVDIDPREAERQKALHINMDAKEFIETWEPNVSCYSWLKQCQGWKAKHEWLEYPAHDDTNGYINSYQFVRRLEPFLRPDEVIVVDDGAMMCPVYQSLRVKPPQRVMTSGSLGEMGCALPGAIGASFARGKGEVLVFVGDGGMMLNIQELAVIRHHNLPVKIMVFENDGYAMIKGTYGTIGKARRGVDRASGLSFPDFSAVAHAFGIRTMDVRAWVDFDFGVSEMFAEQGPFLLQVHIDPEQLYAPRLKPIIKDGVITPARFDQLSPLEAHG